MPPKVPRFPFQEPDWESLRQKKPSFSTKDISDIAELAAQYLIPEATELQEKDPLSNLQMLYALSKQKPRKMSKRDERRLERIIMSAFGRSSQTNRNKIPAEGTQPERRWHGMSKEPKTDRIPAQDDGKSLEHAIKEQEKENEKARKAGRKHKKKKRSPAKRKFPKPETLSDEQRKLFFTSNPGGYLDPSTELSFLAKNNAELKAFISKTIGKPAGEVEPSDCDRFFKILNETSKPKLFSIIKNIAANTRDYATSRAPFSFSSILSDRNFKAGVLSIIKKIAANTKEHATAGAFSSLRSLLSNENFKPELLTEELAQSIVKISNTIAANTQGNATSEAFSSLRSLLSNENFKPEMLGQFEQIASIIIGNTQGKATSQAFSAFHSILSNANFKPEMLSIIQEIAANTQGDATSEAFSNLHSILSNRNFKPEMLELARSIAGSVKNIVARLEAADNFIHVGYGREGFQTIFSKLVGKPELLDFFGKFSEVFSEELLTGDRPKKIATLAEKQLPEAFSRINARLAREYDSFKKSFLAGEPLKEGEGKFLFRIVKKIEGEDFENSVGDLARQLGIKNFACVPSDFNRLYKAAQEKLKPIFPLKTYVADYDFAAKEVVVSLPEDVLASLRVALATTKTAENDYKEFLSEVKTRYDEIAEAFAKGKESVIELMRKYGIDSKPYEEGRMNDENATRLLLKKAELPSLSPFIWKAVEKTGQAELFERYLREEPLSQADHARLITIFNNFDVYADEVLRENGLEQLMPSLKGTEAYKQIISARSAVREQAGKVQASVRKMRLVFGGNNRLLDVFFGSHSGTCFGDYPAKTLARSDICTATLFQNGEVAGGILFVMKEIEGKNSLVIISVDPSEKVFGTESFRLSVEKQNELAGWMLRECKKYADSMGFPLYITAQGGGLTNRYGLALSGYFGKRIVALKGIDPFHPNYKYTITSAHEFIMPI
ncbi:MAG: hypothetical protein N3E51_04285 [Candidatus Micrarchaeota archaeon]|nr:hypothetical protein [Candidatus Micrarchaeota archaeon]